VDQHSGVRARGRLTVGVGGCRGDHCTPRRTVKPGLRGNVCVQVCGLIGSVVEATVVRAGGGGGCAATTAERCRTHRSHREGPLACLCLSHPAALACLVVSEREDNAGAVRARRARSRRRTPWARAQARRGRRHRLADLTGGAGHAGGGVAMVLVPLDDILVEQIAIRGIPPSPRPGDGGEQNELSVWWTRRHAR
jgi:hypothetical protein